MFFLSGWEVVVNKVFFIDKWYCIFFQRLLLKKIFNCLVVIFDFNCLFMSFLESCNFIEISILLVKIVMCVNICCVFLKFLFSGSGV